MVIRKDTSVLADKARRQAAHAFALAKNARTRGDHRSAEHWERVGNNLELDMQQYQRGQTPPQGARHVSK